MAKPSTDPARPPPCPNCPGPEVLLQQIAEMRCAMALDTDGSATLARASFIAGEQAKFSVGDETIHARRARLRVAVEIRRRLRRMAPMFARLVKPDLF